MNENKLNCPAKNRHCGGCPYLNKPYEEQLAEKQALIEKLIGKYCPVAPIIGMDSPVYYRNKAISTFGSDRQGKLICGIYEEGTHRIVPSADCLLTDERLHKAEAAILQSARKCRYTAYNEDTGKGLLRHMQLRVSNAKGDISAIIVTPTAFLPGNRDFVKRIREACPEITTIVQNINPRSTSAVLGREEKLLFGTGYIEDTICGRKFSVSPYAFCQVNSVQTEKLYRKAIEFADPKPGETILDAYCGIGTVGICAAGTDTPLTGIELNRVAVKDAHRNAVRNGLKNSRFICADAGEYLESVSAEGEVPDIVFMDPPRSGSSEEFLSALCWMLPERVVYISCGPDTLARDLEYLVTHGYRAVKAQPVDMFPHTEHVETVVLLSKGVIDSQKIRVEFSLENLDITSFRGKATYEQIKDYVFQQTGMKVSSLYISQVKRKCGLDVGDSYNKPKAEDAKQPQCPPEKELAIMDALKHFGLI